MWTLKMGSHFPFKDLMFKLWTKKRLEIKLLWVKKSSIGMCDLSLKSSFQGM
jgi:hypothetical protein